MIRKILILAIAACSTLTGIAQAMQPPPAQRPQADEATTRMVWRGVDYLFPELMEGPEKSGIFIVMVALRPDGGFVHSDMQYAESRAAQTPLIQAMRDRLPGEGKAIPLPAFNRKGAAVLGERTLKGEVYLNAIMVPDTWDAARDRGVVRRAVLKDHLDLFLPVTGDHINQVTLVLNEKGEVAARRVDPLVIEHLGAETIIRRRRVAASDFAALGLNADQVGIMGELSLPRPAPAPGAPGATSAELQQLYVRFAWPRREGEAAGVDPWAPAPISQNGKPSDEMQKIMNLVEQHFPAAGNPKDGSWIVLDSRGEFVRKGYAEVTKDEPLTSRLTNGYLERQFPGVKVAKMSGISRQLAPPQAGGSPGPQVIVMVYMLAEGSPLPPMGE